MPPQKKTQPSHATEHHTEGKDHFFCCCSYWNDATGKGQLCCFPFEIGTQDQWNEKFEQYVKKVKGIWTTNTQPPTKTDMPAQLHMDVSVFS
jgi:hypothetical protein